MQTTVRPQIEKLLAVHYLSVFRVACRFCASPESAEVLTDYTLRLALERSRSLPVPADVRGWLLSILFHECLEARSASFCGNDDVRHFSSGFDSRATS